MTLRDIGQLFLLALVAGIIGGYTGYMIAQTSSLSSFITTPDDTLTRGSNQDRGTSLPPLPVVQPISPESSEETEKEMQRTLLQIRTTVIGIYRKKALPPHAKLQDTAYLPSDILGFGAILTSDGWLLSTKDVLSERKLEDIAVVANSTIFTPTKHIIDEATGIVFLKIPTTNLPVVTIANENTLRLGQILLTLDAGKNVNIVSLNSQQYRDIQQPLDLIESSERLDSSLLILQGTSLTKAPLGLPVFTRNGALLGLVLSLTSDKQGIKVVPVTHLQNILEDVFQQGEIKRPFLGAEYINLDSLIITEQILKQFQIPATSKRGAFVLKSKAQPLPDTISGDEQYPPWLKPNDIIFKVNEEAVNAEYPLSTLIQQYQPGDTINLLLLRAGKEIKVPVTLSSF